MLFSVRQEGYMRNGSADLTEILEVSMVFTISGIDRTNP